MDDIAEAYRVAVAWGPTAQPIGERNLWRNGTDHDAERCKWTRPDGCVCWRDAGNDDVCHRHEENLWNYLTRTCDGFEQVVKVVQRLRGDASRIRRRGVYFVTGGDAVKIGQTSGGRARLQSMQVGSPVQLELVRFIDLLDTDTLERWLHERYAQYRRHGEWFDAEPVLGDASWRSDEWFRAESGAGMRISGTAEAVMRFYGTPEGRFAAEHLELRAEITDRAPVRIWRQTRPLQEAAWAA